MRSLSSNRMVWGVALLLTFMVGTQARADLVVEYNSLVTGDTPSGAGPWLRATLTDVAVGTVRIKLENLLNSATEFISNVYFNVNPALSESGWTFSFLSGQNTVSTPVVDQDNYNGPGSGKFDLRFEYETANNSNRFTMGETSEFTIQKAGITSASFWFPSKNKGEYTVAHVQGIGTSGSGTVRGSQVNPIPAPAAGLLVLVGLAVTGGFRRRLS